MVGTLGAFFFLLIECWTETAPFRRLGQQFFLYKFLIFSYGNWSFSFIIIIKTDRPISSLVFFSAVDRWYIKVGLLMFSSHHIVARAHDFTSTVNNFLLF